MTLLHAGDRTYAMPDAPMECGLCGAMAGMFINWRGETFCARCQSMEIGRCGNSMIGEVGEIA